MRTIVNQMCNSATSVGSTAMFTVSPNVVPKCNVNGTLRLRVRSGRKNSMGAFFRAARRCLNTLGRHPRVTVTCSAFSMHCPR